MVEDESGDPVVVRLQGLPQFIYARESCNYCSGRGWIGYSHGCSSCLGTGKKLDSQCLPCDGTGEPTFTGEKYRIMCKCLKLEKEFEVKDERQDN